MEFGFYEYKFEINTLTLNIFNIDSGYCSATINPYCNVYGRLNQFIYVRHPLSIYVNHNSMKHEQKIFEVCLFSFCGVLEKICSFRYFHLENFSISRIYLSWNILLKTVNIGIISNVRLL